MRRIIVLCIVTQMIPEANKAMQLRFVCNLDVLMHTESRKLLCFGCTLKVGSH